MWVLQPPRASAKFDFLLTIANSLLEPQQKTRVASHIIYVILGIPLRSRHKMSPWRDWSGSSQAPAVHWSHWPYFNLVFFFLSLCIFMFIGIFSVYWNIFNILAYFPSASDLPH